MLDLRTIPLPDLKALIIVCDTMAKRGNRYFEDQFVILSRVALSTHEMLEMSEYKTDDLVEAIDYLKTAIDGLENLPHDHPGKMFLKYSLTAAHDELQKRARKEVLHAVK
jgi:hypothetical protein